MEGTWKTVVAGSEIREFPLRILGVVDNFAGPKAKVIIAEAIDEENLLSGPVGGMSGSPVFIDGKLLGAYAYGYLWPKEQAIIGITPIDQMFEVLDKGNALNETASIHSGYQPQTRLYENAWNHWNIDELTWGALRGTASRHITAQRFADPAFSPLPTPLHLGGFSSKVIETFRDHWKAMGWEVASAPVSSSSSRGDWDKTLPAGSPVAGVLMEGDFSASGVGTVTWNEDGQLLGFGHPFFGIGPVEIPMAPAEILTVVRSVPRSFKLSNTGPVVGTIFQDRLTAIAGEMGLSPRMIDISIQLKGDDIAHQTFTARAMHHPMISSQLVAMALMQSLTSTLQSELDQTFQINAELQFGGLPPLPYQQAGSGSLGALTALLDIMGISNAFLNNPFEETRLESVAVEVDVSNSIEQTRLTSIEILTARARAGQEVDIQVSLQDFRGSSISKIFTIPLPEGLEGRQFSITIADAQTEQRLRGSPITPGINSVEGLFNDLKDLPRLNEMVVRLDLESPGVTLRGSRLEDLPPSVKTLLDSPRTIEVSQSLTRRKIWEERVLFPGSFEGNHSIPFTLEP